MQSYMSLRHPTTPHYTPLVTTHYTYTCFPPFLLSFSKMTNLIFFLPKNPPSNLILIFKILNIKIKQANYNQI